MNSNALETMIVPAVRGVFLILMLGAVARGLVRMIGVVAASARHPERLVSETPATSSASALEAAAEPDRRIADEALTPGIVA